MRSWDVSAAKVERRVFEVRELDNDASFLRNYLTRDLVEELDLYLYRLEGDKWVIVEKDWEVVRDTILASMTNFGQPYIVVEDGDYRRGPRAVPEASARGRRSRSGYADKTLKYVYQLGLARCTWKRSLKARRRCSYEGQAWHEARASSAARKRLLLH